MQKVPRNDKKAPLSTHRAGHSIQSQNICRGARQQRFPRLRHTARRGHPLSGQTREDAALWPQRINVHRQNARLVNVAQYNDNTRINVHRQSVRTVERRQAFLPFRAASNPRISAEDRGKRRCLYSHRPTLRRTSAVRPNARGRAKMPPFGCGESTCIGKTRGWSMWHGTTTIRGSTCTGKACARSREDAALWPRRVHPPAGRDVRALIPRAAAPHPASHIARRPPASRRGGGPSAIHTPRAPLRARPHGR